MGKRYLIDSNILIDLISQKLSTQVSDAIKEIIDQGFIISFITKIEVLGYEQATDGWERFINQAQMLTFDDTIITQTILIRKRRKIKLPDAIIAATATVNQLVLITRNVNDFANIKGLNVENPWLWDTK